MGAENKEFTMQLKEGQHEFLKKMKETYYLPDESKALRGLINFAMEEKDLESRIFEEMRCLDY